MYKIGIDVGGTFTDFVVAKPGDTPRYFKTPSTPADPSQAVMAGLQIAAEAYGQTLHQFLEDTELVIHGTTVATNTLVERKGAKVGLITTQGFRDLLEMREGLKEDRYNLRMTPVEPLVPRYLRLGVTERVRSSGAVQTLLDEAALDQTLDQLIDEGVEALAVCFLFSYLNPAHEEIVAEKIEARFPGMYTSLSSRVIPQIKEFDRLSTTVVNSYVGPVFGRYLQNLRERLSSFRGLQDILVMQSNGGVASLEDSSRLAVRAILSGPAGGVSGAASYGKLLGESKIIAFDMGGTSTDISLVEEGAPHLTTEKFEGGWKIAVPMIDIHTLGAGGEASPPWVRRHPSRWSRERGAEPGPACYAKGGVQPTVTDANLVLGLPGLEQFPGRPSPARPGVGGKGSDGAHRRSPWAVNGGGGSRRLPGGVHQHGRGHPPDVGTTRR